MDLCYSREWPKQGTTSHGRPLRNQRRDPAKEFPMFSFAKSFGNRYASGRWLQRARFKRLMTLLAGRDVTQTTTLGTDWRGRPVSENTSEAVSLPGVDLYATLCPSAFPEAPARLERSNVQGSWESKVNTEPPEN
jgi:hypothetical protein